MTVAEAGGPREGAGAGGLHLCGQPPATRPSVPRRRAGGAALVDLHCHYLNQDVEAFVATLPKLPAPPQPDSPEAAESLRYNAELIRTTYFPKLTDIPTRLADMDAMGVDIQAISPSPTQYHYWAEPDAAVEIVLRQNERIASVCADHPERLVGFGTVALQHPALAAEQARHAVQGLGLRGIEISSLVGGLAVDDARFHPFWAEMERLDAPVLLHPLGTTVGKRLDNNYLSNVVGQPAETAIALSRMIMSGHFDRFASLKLCAVHGGGYLPLYMGRSDHAFRVRPECQGCAATPSDYLRRLWFDTVVYDPRGLRHLIDVVGVERIVIGTDYPFDMGHYDPIGLVEAVEGLTDLERAAILGGNARRLLGIADQPGEARAPEPVNDRAGGSA